MDWNTILSALLSIPNALLENMFFIYNGRKPRPREITMIRKFIGWFITIAIISAILYGIWVASQKFSDPISTSIIKSYIDSKIIGVIITIAIRLVFFSLFVWLAYFVVGRIFRVPRKKQGNDKRTEVTKTKKSGKARHR